MSENAIDDAAIEEEGPVEGTEPATETGERGAGQPAEEAEHAIELAEELRQMAATVGELENRVAQLENSIAVIVEAGATVMEAPSQAPDDGGGDDFLYLEDLDY